MADYSLLSTDDNETVHLSDTMIESATSDEFGSFSSSNMIVTFNKIKLSYNSNESLWAYFSVFASQYEMKDDDLIGICPISDDKFLVSTAVKDCQVDNEFEELDDIDLLNGDRIIAKKTCFKLGETEIIAINSTCDASKPMHFQFCYKTGDGNVIKGKSTPFTLKINGLTRQPSNDVPAIDNTMENFGEREDDDFIVVRAPESFLKERIEHLTKSNTLLQYLIKNMESDLLKVNNEMKDLKSNLEARMEEVNSLQKAKVESDELLAHVNLQKSDLDNAKSKLQEAFQKEVDMRKQLEKELADMKEFCKNYEQNDKEAEHLKAILKEKEEEISIARDMYNNIQVINSDLLKKVDKLEDDLDSTKSFLAKVLDEKRTLLSEKSKWELSHKTMDESNAILLSRIEELQSRNDKYTQEMQTLRDELKRALENVKQNESKYTEEQKKNSILNHKLALEKDRMNTQCLEMRVRLEQAKVEYGNLYVKYQNIKKKFGRNREMSDVSSVAGLSSSFIDPIDQALRQLEMEEDNKSQQSMAQATAPPAPSEDDVVIEDIIEGRESRSQVNTAVKTLATPTTSTNSGDQLYPNLNRQDSEQQQSKSNIVKIPCVMCNAMIDCTENGGGENNSGQLKEMIEHFENVHKHKMCPVCSVLFDMKLPIFKTYFTNHLENHFKSMKYPG